MTDAPGEVEVAFDAGSGKLHLRYFEFLMQGSVNQAYAAEVEPINLTVADPSQKSLDSPSGARFFWGFDYTVIGCALCYGSTAICLAIVACIMMIYQMN